MASHAIVASRFTLAELGVNIAQVESTLATLHISSCFSEFVVILVFGRWYKLRHEKIHKLNYLNATNAFWRGCALISLLAVVSCKTPSPYDSFAWAKEMKGSPSALTLSIGSTSLTREEPTRSALYIRLYSTCTLRWITLRVFVDVCHLLDTSARSIFLGLIS